MKSLSILRCAVATLLLMAAGTVAAATHAQSPASDESSEVRMMAQQMPSFKGGTVAAYQKWVSFKVRSEARAKGGEGHLQRQCPLRGRYAGAGDRHRGEVRLVAGVCRRGDAGYGALAQVACGPAGRQAGEGAAADNGDGRNLMRTCRRESAPGPRAPVRGVHVP